MLALFACKKDERVYDAAPLVGATGPSAVAADTNAPHEPTAAEVGVASDGGEGIGLGNIGLIGGRMTPHDGGTLHSPRIRQGISSVVGRLPPEVVYGVVRQSFGRFHLCYEDGLRSNPSLEGRVTVKFVIDRDGSVKSTSTDGAADLPDQRVVQCVLRAFKSLSYPQPEGGIVTVVFPLIFSPGS